MNYAKTALLLAAMTALFLGAGYLLGGAGGAGIAFLVALAMNGYAWWNSDTAALKAHNAEPVTRSGAPDLYEMVERLARNAGLPMPGVYVIHTEQPNAFATGRSPEKAAVAVTTGIMRALDRDELAGVIAHELAHIRNRDTLIMTVSATIAGAIGFLAQFALFFRGNRGAGGIIGALLVMILAPLAASVVQMTISRTREYAADRAGAEICGAPLDLASALRKIAGGAARAEMESAERNPATAHLFIVNPLNGQGADKLFSTHPATENRIAALEEMAGRALVARRQGAAEESRAPRRPGSRRDPRSGPNSGPWA